MTFFQFPAGLSPGELMARHPLAADGDLGVITGKVSRAVPDLDQINRELGYQRVQMTLLATRVGAGRPRYLMVEVPRLVEVEEQVSR